MADIKRRSTATWQGTPKDGSGEISAESGTFADVDYSFPSRFEDGSGTNPEELIGGAHAACFNMVVAKQLAARGDGPERLETEATVTLREDGGDYEVAAIHLDSTASVPGIEESTFREVAQTALETCPISQLLGPGLGKMTVEARLE